MLIVSRLPSMPDGSLSERKITCKGESRTEAANSHTTCLTRGQARSMNSTRMGAVPEARELSARSGMPAASRIVSQHTENPLAEIQQRQVAEFRSHDLQPAGQRVTLRPEDWQTER